MDAGFDGVEVHGGNGYLLDQFLRSSTNQRTDAYGGSKENRARLLLEIIAAVCAAIGNDRVGLRLSPVTPFNDISDDQSAGNLRLRGRRTQSASTSPSSTSCRAPAASPQDQWLPFDYARLRAIYKGNLILNNGYDFASAQQAVQTGAADAIAFGRALLANPDLVERFRRGAPLNQPDYEKLYVGEEKGYTDYPFLAA